jgi:transcriptional regulator with XRE-family HTH domain
MAHIDGKSLVERLLQDRGWGGRSRLARELEVKPGTITRWLKGERQVSSEYIPRLRKLNGLPDDDEQRDEHDRRVAAEAKLEMAREQLDRYEDRFESLLKECERWVFESDKRGTRERDAAGAHGPTTPVGLTNAK